MKKNQEFADEKERLGFAKLVDLNALLQIANLGQTPPKSATDASGITINGGILAIEIKVRDLNLINDGMAVSGHSTTNNRPYTGSTVYIEMHKMADMLLDYLFEGKTPLYVNFLNNDIAVVFNLSKLSRRPMTIAKGIKSKLYDNKFEIGKRIELPLGEGWIYQKTENKWRIIAKPTWLAEMKR